jgi:PAS domain-containing protein
LLQTVFPKGVTSLNVDDQLRRAGNWEGELIHTAKDGHKITVESRMRVMGEIAQPVVLEANRDISDRKRAEEALQQSESRFRQLANTIPQLVWMAQPDGNIYWYNQR